MTVARIAIGIAAFLVAALGVPLTNKLAVRLGAVVQPRGDRFSRRVVPVLGGLAVAAAVTAVAFAAVDEAPTLVAWLAGLVGLTAIGLVDDLSGVRPRYRLLAEAALGAGFTFVVFDDWSFWSRTAAVLVGFVAIPVVTNATNLIDNADGLASSLSAETALTVALLAAAAGLRGNEIALGLAVCGACLGFLVHNRPPARVFMGDAGSLMLGFALAGAAILLVRDAIRHPDPPAAAAALAVPLAFVVQMGDVVMVSVTRIRRGVSPFRGGIDHTSHRLVRAGFGAWGMLGALAGAGAVCCGLGLVLVWSAPHPAVVIAAVVVAGLAALALETVVAVRFPAEPAMTRDATGGAR